MGKLTVITGCMGSGKTSKLITLVSDHENALNSMAVMTRPIVTALKPSMDSRSCTISSRDGREIECVPVSEPFETYVPLMSTLLVIDEAQFFDSDKLQDAITHYINHMDIIVCGLSSDFSNSPFGGMPSVLAMADKIIHLTAVCNRCGGTATRTHRLSDELEQIVVGGDDLYEAICHKCWEYV